jgi:hypothetical protein
MTWLRWLGLPRVRVIASAVLRPLTRLYYWRTFRHGMPTGYKAREVAV